MVTVDYDMTKLRKLGDRRRAALAELEAVRREVEAEIPAARGAKLTWREIGAATNYTENRLQRMAAEGGS